MKLIIYAGDLGYARQVKQAKVTSLPNNICSCTSILPNKARFEKVCKLVQKNKLKKDIH